MRVVGSGARPTTASTATRTHDLANASQELGRRAAPLSFGEQSLPQRHHDHDVLNRNHILTHESFDEGPVARVVERIVDVAHAPLSRASHGHECRRHRQVTGHGIAHVEADVGVPSGSVRAMRPHPTTTRSRDRSDVEHRTGMTRGDARCCPLEKIDHLLGSMCVARNSHVQVRRRAQRNAVEQPAGVGSPDRPALGFGALGRRVVRAHVVGTCDAARLSVPRFHLGLRHHRRDRDDRAGQEADAEHGEAHDRFSA